MIQLEANMVIKCIIMEIYSVVTFLYIKNCRKIGFWKGIYLMVSAICLSLAYELLNAFVDIIMSEVIVCMLQALIFKPIIKSNFFNTVISTTIARVISYIFLIISGTLDFLICGFKVNNVLVNLVITFFIEGILIYLLFNTKRLKNGLSFLNTQNEYIEIAMINIATILLLLHGLISFNNDKVYKNLYFYYIILGLLMGLMIYRTISMYYKQKLVNTTIEEYKKELEEKDNEIQRLTEETFKVSKINHEFYNRQKSLELMVKNAIQNTSMETAEELDIMDRINKITKEHSQKMDEIKSLPKLPLTEIQEIDDMFTYMQEECDKNKIKFKLKISGNIHSLTNNIIQKSKLETLIGDHVRDAIIAVNSSKNANREIFVVLGLKDKYYELAIFDTGIEFEIETLLKLGTEPITTHKDTGGSGIGFMTTFETLRECKGSLIIEEKHKINESDYTKAVKIRFDGKNEYKIYSYRAKEIKAMSKDNRIKIEQIEEN